MNDLVARNPSDPVTARESRPRDLFEGERVFCHLWQINSLHTRGPRISLAEGTHEFATNAEDPKQAVKAVIQTYPTIR